MVNPHPPLGRQESYTSKTKSLDYRNVRGGPNRQSISEPVRSLSVPPRPIGNLGRFDSSREPAYWGIAYPLRHDILYPEPLDSNPSPRFDLPGIVGAWLKSSTRHTPSLCLSCCRLRPSARPRAASLSVTKDDPR